MSKSIGNIVTINKLRERVNGQVVRLALLSSHYKQPLDWNEKLIKESQNTLDEWYNQFEQTSTSELNEDVLRPLQEDLNTPEYIAKLHSLFEDSSNGKRSSKVKFLSACQHIGLLKDRKSWEDFKKSKVTIDENFINQKIKDRNEARKKGDYKLADIIRKELENKVGDFNEFLKQMNIQVNVQKANSFSIPRISQLTLKTNQFNLTTKRYTEADIKNFIDAPDYDVYAFSAIDKFGDNGITGVYIVRKHEKFWLIDTFLLSCRIM